MDRLGLNEMYVADLTAIAASLERSRHHARTTSVPPRLASTLRHHRHGVVSGSTPACLSRRARHALALGAARVVVGLETLPSFEALEDICRAVGGPRGLQP